MRNSLSSNNHYQNKKNQKFSIGNKEIKTSNVNILLNRVKLDKKKESRKKIFFTAATSLSVVLFGILIF